MIHGETRPTRPAKIRLIPAVALLAALLAAPWTGRAATNDVVSVAKSFVDLLAKEDYAGASARCDATMKAALPEAGLREVWQGLQVETGAYQKQLQTQVTNAEGFDIVLVTCQFERAVLDLKVVLNDQRLVSGLFYVPTRPATGPLTLPSYTKEGAYRETNFTVGRGEWALPGTLTLPVTGKGPWPAVVLVHGSGPNDRDETVSANKPFRDLALGLASKGIAVLRYEKRTREHGAKLIAEGLGKFTVQEETVADAVSAVAQLRATEGIATNRVFVLGHSLGGTLAPRIAKADPAIAGLIIMAGATRPLEDLIVEQTVYLSKLNRKPTAADAANIDRVKAAAARIKELKPADADSGVMLLNAPVSYWLDLRGYEPVKAAKKLKQPMLIMQGRRDYQVTMRDYYEWADGFGYSAPVTFKLYPNLNHLFMVGEGAGRPAEYDKPAHVAAEVVTEIADWIHKTKGN